MGSGKQLLQGLPGVVGAHEGLAHQKCADTCCTHLSHIGLRENATLGDDEAVSRDAVQL
jgi:hypothetical protein